MKKRILSFALVLCMVLTLMPVSAFADDIVASGECGDNLTWQLNSDGVLTIGGTGKMYTYSSYVQRDDAIYPTWYSSRYSIKYVDIKSGVTSIGDGAFLIA